MADACIFAEWQPRYAEAGISTFPVRDKKPAIRGYLKTGPNLSRQLADKFGDAPALGFSCKRAGLPIVDVDTTDETILADALARYGATPHVVRTGSGHFQVWYRHGGARYGGGSIGIEVVSEFRSRSYADLYKK